MMTRTDIAVAWAIWLMFIGELGAITYGPRPDYGYPAGFLSDCPGTEKNASISAKSLPLLKVTVHRLSSKGEIIRRTYPVESAHKFIARDKHFDLKNKKTIFFAVGYLDSSVFPFSRPIGTSYSKRGYNVIFSETFAFLTSIYPNVPRRLAALPR